MPDETDTSQVLSRAAYERLRTELEDLQTEGRRDMAARLQRARELGDLSENAEYHETKNQQGMMEARIRKLEHILKNAKIVDGPVTADQAVAGTVVTLKPLDDPGSEPETYLLAASSEERAKSVFTVTIVSPLGQALNGCKVGDTVKYTAPGGTFSYEVLKIEPWDGSV